MNLGARTRQALARAAVRSHLRQGEPPRTTRADLIEWARAHLPDRRLVVVSNREPYSHVHADQGIRAVRNAGGLIVALDAVMQALGGVWVAHGSGDADREAVDSRQRVACPPDRPKYSLRRIWLTAEDHDRYYSGFANSALWPLCHIAYVRPRFRLEDWKSYVEVNRRFAEAALEEMGDAQGLVFIQDYHLALAAKFIRERRPDLQVALFWHIPWPNAEVFRILPWREELLDGMLANDVIGFHIRRHASNFLDSVAETFEAKVDHDHRAVERAGRRTWVRPFAISVDSDEIGALVESAPARAAEAELRARLGLDGCRVGLGVDRLDYTKGIPERFEALERMFQKHPEWVGRFAFIQIGVPSRIELPPYRAIQARTRRWAERINRLYPRPNGPTVHLVEANLDFRELVPYYRTADFCAVTSLHDGMNLVAKEYLAACPDLDGALVLSPFTGAASELERAWIASPFDREGLADAYHAALSAPPETRIERMRALRETVLRHNVFDWALEVLDTIVGLQLITPTAGPAAADAGSESIRTP